MGIRAILRLIKIVLFCCPQRSTIQRHWFLLPASMVLVITLSGWWLLHHTMLSSPASKVIFATQSITTPSKQVKNVSSIQMATKESPTDVPAISLKLRSPCIMEPPNMLILQKLNVFEEIATSGNAFGTSLLEDGTGSKMSGIKHSAKNLEEINREIFQRWLKGEGKQPTTWNTLIKVLNEVHLHVLADKIGNQVNQDYYYKETLLQIKGEHRWKRTRTRIRPLIVRRPRTRMRTRTRTRTRTRQKTPEKFITSLIC